MAYDAVFEEIKKRGGSFSFIELIKILHRFGLNSDAIRYYVGKGWLKYENGGYKVI